MSRPSAINSTAHMDMDSFTVGVVEQRLHRKRWCAYHGTFHDLDSFSDAQKMAPFANRYCLQFANHTVRAAAHVRPPTISVVDMRALSSKLKITIDNLPAIAEPAGRGGARKRNTEASDDDDEIPDETPEPSGKRVKATAASSAGGSKAAQPKRKGSTSPSKSKTSKAAMPKDRPLLSVEELESWIATSLSSTERYDIHDNSRRDNYLGTIESYNESDLTDIDWQTALGEVRAKRSLTHALCSCIRRHNPTPIPCRSRPMTGGRPQLRKTLGSWRRTRCPRSPSSQTKACESRSRNTLGRSRAASSVRASAH